MKIKFIGATGRVTGSCYWLKYENTEFLVDCGQIQGERDSDFENHNEFPFNPKNLRYVILTHAHLDHCGLIPKLYKEGFKGKVICTKATADLAKIVLRDSINFAPPFEEKDIDNIKFSHMEDGKENIFSRFYTIENNLRVLFKRNAHILGSVSVVIGWKYDNTDWKNLEFSGDIGSNQEGKEHLPMLLGRKEAHECNFTVMESTYGNREVDKDYKDFDKRIERLEKIINESLIKMPDKESPTFENDREKKIKTIVIPAFAVQRAQDILFDLYYIFKKNQGNPEWDKRQIDIYFDYPMGLKVNKVFREELLDTYQKTDGEVRLKWVNDIFIKDKFDIKSDEELEKFLEELLPTEEKEYIWFSQTESIKGTKLKVLSADEHKAIKENKLQFKIIITGGGMCEGGNIGKYLDILHQDKHSMFLLTGYQAEKTNGYKLKEHSEKTEEERKSSEEILEFKTFKIDSDKKNKGKKNNGKNNYKSEPVTISCGDIKAEIKSIQGYSGHADQKGLMEWFFNDDDGIEGKKRKQKTIFLTHGDDESRKKLKEKLEEYNSNKNITDEFIVELPKKDDDKLFNLDTNEWEDDSELYLGPKEEKIINILTDKVVDNIKDKLIDEIADKVVDKIKNLLISEHNSINKE